MKLIDSGTAASGLADQPYSGLMELHVIYPEDYAYIPNAPSLLALADLLRASGVDVISTRLDGSTVKFRFNGQEGDGSQWSLYGMQGTLGWELYAGQWYETTTAKLGFGAALVLGLVVVSKRRR